MLILVGLALFLLAVGLGWSFVVRRKADQAERQRLRQSQARVQEWKAPYRRAFETLLGLRTDQGIDEVRLARWLAQRTQAKQRLSEVWELGLGGLPEHRRGFEVLESVRILEPVLLKDFKSDFYSSLPNIAVAIWALDAFSLRAADPAVVQEAGKLRQRLVEALREERPNTISVAPEEWAVITGGKFLMGPESDPGWSPSEISNRRHPVEISTFHILKHEVTNEEFAGFPGTNHPARYGKPNHPATHVSWYEAYGFAAWLGGRLPTEAEWEYAARSEGLDRRFPWGDGTADICERAVVRGIGVPGRKFPENQRECGVSETSPVCSLPKGRTRQGVCDMAGNV